MADGYLTSKEDCLRRTLELCLENARTDYWHSGNIGCAVEVGIRSFLRRYIPRALEVCHGEIIDSHGKRSGQTDIIIVNEEHPISNQESGPSTCFIEGVEATGEAKSVLTTSELKSTLKNSQKVKALTPWKKKGAFYNGNISDLARFENRKPFFLIAIESQIQILKVAKVLKDYIEQHKLETCDVVDAVFLLDRKEVLMDYGDGKCTIQSIRDDGTAATGMQARDSEAIVSDILNWLYASMLRMKGIDDFLHFYTSIESN